MGTSYTNCQVSSSSPEDVVRALSGLPKEPAYVSPAVNGWVGVYPEGGATGTTNAIELAEELSARLSGAVITFMVHDSDVFCYWLHEGGTLRDEFNSDPDWGTDPDDEHFPPPTAEDRARMQGRPEALLPYCTPGVDRAQVQEVLHPTQPETKWSDLSAQTPEFSARVQRQMDDAVGRWAHLLGTTPEALREGIEQKRREKYAFAEEQAADLAKLLGMDEELARSEYRDIAEGEMEEVSVGDFRLVGSENLSQEYKNQKLWDIEAMQDPEKLRYWLRQGADPNARDRQGVPVLVYWAQYCLPGPMTVLLDEGADINLGTTPSPDLEWGYGLEGGVSALMAVAGSTYEQPDRVPDTVELLLERGADVNARSETGRTALGEALKMTDWRSHQGRIGRMAPEAVLKEAAARSSRVVEMLRAAGAEE